MPIETNRMVRLLASNRKKSAFLSAGLILASFIQTSESLLTAGPHSTGSRTATRAHKTMCFSKKDGENEQDYTVQTRNPLRLGVLRLGLTEPMATSPLNYGKYDGQFTCAYCGQELFDSNAKYDSGSGWPAFWRTAGADSIQYKAEADGRLECQCKRCSSHLGHVFLDGPRPSEVSQEVVEASPESDPRGKNGVYLPRFCVNGASLNYKERSEE